MKAVDQCSQRVLPQLLGVEIRISPPAPQLHGREPLAQRGELRDDGDNGVVAQEPGIGAFLNEHLQPVKTL